jgi:hypothetical protein
MRSYNYVVIPTHDYDHVVYRIRAIDFDQQSYEGNLKIYLPQYFKENFRMVKLVMDKLKPNSVEQYRKEVRSVIAKRLLNSHERYLDLVSILKRQHSPKKPRNRTAHRFTKATYDSKFRLCENMGDIAEIGLEFVMKITARQSRLLVFYHFYTK